MNDSGFYRTLHSIGLLAEAEFFLHLATFTLFLDACLSAGYRISVGGLTYSWIDANVSLGEILLFLLLYSMMMAYIFPLLRLFYVSLWAIPFYAFFMMHSGFRSEFNEKLLNKSFSVEDVVAYSVAKGSAPAYGEVTHKRAINDRDHKIPNQLSINLLFLISVGVVFHGAGYPTIVSRLYDVWQGAAGVTSYALMVIAILLLVGLMIDALLWIPLGLFSGVRFNNEALAADVRSFLEKSRADGKL